MSQRKRVRVTCYGPMSVYPEAESPWEDVWVSWKTRPGRSRERYIVTVAGRQNLESDLNIVSKCLDDAVAEHDEKLIETFKVDLLQLQRILAAVSLCGVLDETDKDGCVDIYVNKEFLNRVDTENALISWLEREHGVKRPKFAWRRPKAFILSM